MTDVTVGPDAPPLQAVLEVCLYYSGPQEMEMICFYRDSLGLPRAGDDDLAYRIGGNLILLFDRDDARAKKAPRPPAHGTDGASHVCFLSADGYRAWRGFIEGQGIQIVREITWPTGHQSFYFEDPCGNVLEIADGDMWPR